jgi:adenylyl cyclase-associated protein
LLYNFFLNIQGLKKVTADMQTHKNPGLRDTKPIPAKEKKSVSPPKYGASTAPQKPPKFELEGKKWIVEFQRNNSGIVIPADQAEVNQSVYVYKCDGSTIQVKGKVNNIILDSCKKTAVVFGSVVSSCEFINCQSVQMQVDCFT